MQVTYALHLAEQRKLESKLKARIRRSGIQKRWEIYDSMNFNTVSKTAVMSLLYQFMIGLEINGLVYGEKLGITKEVYTKPIKKSKYPMYTYIWHTEEMNYYELKLKQRFNINLQPIYDAYAKTNKKTEQEVLEELLHSVVIVMRRLGFIKVPQPTRQTI